MSSTFFADKIMPIMEKYNNYNSNDKDVVRYGIEILYIFLTKTILLMYISILLKMGYEFILLIFFYGILRGVAGGFHLKNGHLCTLLSGAVLLFITHISIYSKINIWVTLIILIFCLLSYIKFSPGETYKRPIKKREKRIKKKKETIFVFLIYCTIMLIFNNIIINNILIYSLLLEAIVINPLSYKLFNVPYCIYTEH